MGLYFGTDGVRGVFNKTLTLDLAYRIGYTLARQNNCRKVVIGQDTRQSGNVLKHTISLGLILGGTNVVDVGVCPTAGISYLTISNKFDFGIVVTASHNPSEYNGIKIFGSDGKKINENIENNIEKNLFLTLNIFELDKIGKYECNEKLKNKYVKFLKNECLNLEKFKVVLDCANGAAYKIAEKVFKDANAKVITIGNKPNGKNINENCGALHIDNLTKAVKLYKADFGFAFDGDSDRVFAVDEKGKVVDGDKIIYLFATKYKAENKLKGNAVVCTHMTNMKIEDELKILGISMRRTDVGDKYVMQALDENNLIIGGEQCGHIFLKDKMPTGDGILNAITIANICKEYDKKLSECFDFKLNKQIKTDIKCKDKNLVLKCKKLQNFIKNIQTTHKNNIKLFIRASGTEDIIRVLIESPNQKLAKQINKQITEIINKIEGEI